MNDFIINTYDSLRENGYSIGEKLFMDAVRYAFNSKLHTKEEFIVEMCAYMVKKDENILNRGSTAELCNIMDNVAKKYTMVNTEQGIVFVSNSVVKAIDRRIMSKIEKEMQLEGTQKSNDSEEIEAIRNFHIPKL